MNSVTVARVPRRHAIRGPISEGRKGGFCAERGDLVFKMVLKIHPDGTFRFAEPGEGLFAGKRQRDDPKKDPIHRPLYFRTVMLNPDKLALAVEHRDGTISKEEYIRRKRFLFYKLLDEYNAALGVLQRGCALDLEVFFRIFTEDATRRALFAAYSAGEIEPDPYITADEERILELSRVYTDCLTQMMENGETIRDIGPKLLGRRA